jgi:membrane protease subunit (stomatin/prohibitin family)
MVAYGAGHGVVARTIWQRGQRGVAAGLLSTTGVVVVALGASLPAPDGGRRPRGKARLWHLRSWSNSVVSGFLDAVRQEFVDIIAWDEPAPTDLVYRFPRVDAEIKQGAQLIVRPGQAAVFVDQGRIADVFGPGRHVLQTANLPVLATLRGWKYGFDSPFKADVLFVQTVQFPSIKWGTKRPILRTDPEFGVVRVRAYGIFVVAVEDPRRVIEQVAGSGPRMEIGELEERFRDTIVGAALTPVLGGSGQPLTAIASALPELARARQAALVAPFAALGFRLEQLTIENVTLPDTVTAALDRQAAVRVAGGVAGYAQLQSVDAIKSAAEHGGAGGMVGLGAGVLLQQQMAGALGAAAARPPPVPPVATPEPVWRVVRPGRDAPLDGEQDLSESVVRRLIQDRRLVGTDLVWTVGAPAWRPLHARPAFASFFQPPPLPTTDA